MILPVPVLCITTYLLTLSVQLGADSNLWMLLVFICSSLGRMCSALMLMLMLMLFN
ncbi:hypothetical protein HETIRDRAFT_310274 [Heterobasidion irregulare TC 32-1]|uniref:Uncharacterized protein n=1 Tax=Heterobasidion irregulare (strain TC 32-1) TaxID=747525 RepID=W4KK56_HETIT|nr:uncharacterized protein HETIRDRAFT_310274 [Heterobasidion irregulare TC 32-1]ETW85426.1 hypothetical protein HETIRDRAFT_310274 [Heterobasidion irregulare TC 32-1]